MERLANEALKYAEGMLTEKSSFVPFDAAKNAEVKAAIRIYVETWVLPPLRNLVADIEGR